MNKSDLWAGLVLFGLGVAVTRQALRLDYIDEYGPGPGFFPFWIGVALLALAAWLVVLSVFRRSGSRTDGQAAWAETARAIGIWAGFMTAIALLKTLGFFVTFVLSGCFPRLCGEPAFAVGSRDGGTRWRSGLLYHLRGCAWRACSRWALGILRNQTWSSGAIFSWASLSP